MVVSMTTLTGLLLVSGLAVMHVQKAVRAGAHERFSSVALFAAESGVAAAMDYLRDTLDPATYWSGLVSPGNGTISAPAEIPGNGARPGSGPAILSADLGAWFEVSVRNNPDDPGFAAGDDLDGIVVVRAVGHGPDAALVTLEVEVVATEVAQASRPCPGYGQRGMSADGAGRNDCLGHIDGTDTGSFRPSEGGSE